MQPSDLKTILIAGSWGKEQMTIENLRKFGKYRLLSYLDTRNPGILPQVDDYTIGKLTDVDKIVRFAKEKHADIALITTAAPLNAGVVNALEEAGITAFGPDRNAARLETNKAFTRNLLKKYIPDSVPHFRVFSRADEAIGFARELEWQVAVKPLGLTDGLGVRVYGDQLENEDEVKEYINFIIKEAYSGYNEVIIEEKIYGEEFTLQCLVNDTALIHTPTVQDFKKLLPGERGPNTASMGSYSDADHMLPFLGFADYGEAFNIMRRTLEAYKEETGGYCRGFLYGQFMITDKGVRLIEYNFRPGDPEWMNTMLILEEDLMEGIATVMRGEEKSLQFRKRATVCKYIVPPEYPSKLYQTLDVSYDAESIERMGVQLCYSAGLDDRNRLQVGTERGIALLAESDTISRAHKRIERAIKTIEGHYFHRYDIGTARLLRRKTQFMKKLLYTEDADFVMHKATEPEFLEVYDLVRNCPPLEPYGAHLFRILIRYAGNSCYVARMGDRLAGWVMGLMAQTMEDTYFLWQIGVDPDQHGKGIAGRLLKFVEDDLLKSGARRIELTIDPENTASIRLFEKYGYRNISAENGKTTLFNGNEAVINFYSPGRHFMVFEKMLTDEILIN